MATVMKNNKLTLAITSAVTLMPIVAGLILWDKLPDTMVTHWGVSGSADAVSSKTFAVFGMPLILLALHWLCLFVSEKDVRNKNQNPKMKIITFWVCPVTSWLISGMMYFTSLGDDFEVKNVLGLLFIFLALLFCVIGNYLPKCKQNFTMGIKLKWTLENEENWNKTHRLGGIVWFVCGLAMLAAAFLPMKVSIPVMISVMAVAVIVPTVYSYCIYRKMLASGEINPKTTEPWGGFSKKRVVLVSVIIAVVLIFTLVLINTGDIVFNCGDTAVEINADYWDDIVVEYSEIDSITLRNDVDFGLKMNGFDSLRLMLGTFTNDEFGRYTRFTYRKSDLCIVIEDDGNILVLGGKDDAETRRIYDEIISKK